MGKTPDHVESLVHENDREKLEVAQLKRGFKRPVAGVEAATGRDFQKPIDSIHWVCMKIWYIPNMAIRNIMVSHYAADHIGIHGDSK